MKVIIETLGAIGLIAIGFGAGWFKASHSEKYDNSKHPETMGTHTNREL